MTYRAVHALRVGAAAPWIVFVVAGIAIAVSGAYDGVVFGVMGVGLALGSLRSRGPIALVVAILAFLLGLVMFLGIGISGDYYVRLGAPRVLINLYTFAPLVGALLAPPLSTIIVVVERLTRR